MKKGKSAQSREWGPEAFVEWMLKSKSVSKKNIKLLLESKEQISQAWEWDDEGTKSFPMNTANLVYEIESKIKGLRPRNRRKGKGIVLHTRTRLRDILPESTVQQVHEYLYEEPFVESLAELQSSDTSSQAFARIKDTILNALIAEYHGYEYLPKPRGNWLHRQILGILTTAAPGKFSDSDMAKLFDYFCPCGTKHNREAIKKFRWRLARAHG
jgi:hypothetical protein